MATRVSVTLALLLGVCALPAWGQSREPVPSNWFRVSIQPAPEQSVAPTIKGQVYNDSPYRVTDVRLQLEGLGADSRLVGRRFVWAFGDITPGGETSFTAEPIPDATSYRATVSAFDIISIGQAPQAP